MDLFFTCVTLIGWIRLQTQIAVINQLQNRDNLDVYMFCVILPEKIFPLITVWISFLNHGNKKIRHQRYWNKRGNWGKYDGCYQPRCTVILVPFVVIWIIAEDRG